MAVRSRLINIDGLKSELREAITLSQVAEGLGIELVAAGDQWQALCPLHQENTPSFYISDAKGLYHCFGCKEGGDGIDLVQRLRHCDFVEALYWLAGEADVDIEKYERPLTEAELQQERFRGWCEKWLSLPLMPPSRISHVMASRFGVSKAGGTPWSFPGMSSAPAYISDKPYLFNGVILPWRMPSGRLVGWRVREYPGDPKDVISTPNDFPLGKITDTLFGIQLAREHIADGSLIVVEGEYDCIAMHEAGYPNTVAMGGSSITQGQMDLLEQLHVRQVIVVFDGDDAGRLAAKVLAERVWQHNIQVRIGICPDGEDPESMVTRSDISMWQVLADARHALEHLLRIEWAARDRGTLSSKLEFVHWIRSTYGGKLRSADESLVLAEVAKWLQIPEMEVRDFVRSSDTALVVHDSERVLLGAACRERSTFVWLRSQLMQQDFHMLKHQRLWQALSDMLIDGQDFDLITIENRADGLPAGYIRDLVSLPGANLDWHKDQVADLSLRRSARDDALAFKDRITDLSTPAELMVGELTHRVTTKALRKYSAVVRQLPEQVDDAMGELHQRMRNPDGVHGLSLSTQYPGTTRTLQGLQSKRLVLLSAISGMGKSSMLITWAGAIAIQQSIPLDFISLEMDEFEILYKLAAHMTGVDSMKITGGALDDNEARLVERAMDRIRKSPLHVWTPDGLTGTEFLLYARESVMQRQTRAFFLDYIQLVDPESGQERESGYKLYGDFGRLMKMKVARGMDVACVCCAQLNRGASVKERPTKEDIGDSYALVRHSDVVMVLTGEEDSSTMDLWIDKNRQGPGGVLIPIRFDKPISTFSEVDGGTLTPDYLVV